MSSLPQPNYLSEPKGITSWLFTLDHKRIGLMYFFAIMFFFMVGGIFAVLLRLELLQPGPDIMERALMPEANLDDVLYLWQEFPFSNVSGLSPTQGLCLVLAMDTRDRQLADIQYDGSGGSGRCSTSTAGSLWISHSGSSMLYNVYGTVTTVSTPDPVTREWLRSVDIALRVGSDAATRVATATSVLNEPEVTVP